MDKNKPFIMVPAGDTLDGENYDDIKVGDKVWFKDLSFSSGSITGEVISIEKRLFTHYLVKTNVTRIALFTREEVDNIEIYKKYRWQLFKINN